MAEPRVAIVTGGATGIGGAIARRLAADGERVLIADIADELSASNVAQIEAAGGTAAAIHSDVSRHDDIRKMVQDAVERWGRLDILVNNAFPAMEALPGGVEEVTEEQWDFGMSLLVKALFLGAKYAVPEMRRVGGGNIVNIASVHGLLMAKDYLVYEAGKSAAIGVTKQMAIQHGPDNIRVNSICPGHMVTENIQRVMWDDNPDGLKLFADQYPLRRTGKPEEIGSAVSFLCSDDASFVTGHALVVDGGLSIQLQENIGVQQANYMRRHPETQPPY
ncbi:MAG: glucose 1-dehydrogenase [Chloroflexi bacterium]|nr:glucose 1-dehydrogenase [Chloroflexota bacterium]MCY4110643.1 glucose 1-dehydrogenase [Chloroflexota bacterium]